MQASEAVLLLNDDKIAIKVELSAKSKARLSKIMKHYTFSFDCKEVWYFCGSKAVQNAVSDAAAKYDFIKVDWLEEILPYA